MSHNKLKYNISHHLSLRPASISMTQIENILSKDHGISRSTFLRDRSLTKDSDKSIPSDRLEVYAGLFKVTVDELKNSHITVKPLIERKPTPLTKKIIKKSKLRKS